MITTFKSNFETTKNLAQPLVVAHGETFELLAYLFDNGVSVDLTGYDLQLLYQDVANLSAYYTIDGTVDASGGAKVVWTAANDVGARAYRCHLKATKNGEVSYPARWEVGMYPTPDFAASHLDPYVKYIDFDQYELLNAPWALLSDFNSLSSGLSAKADLTAVALAVTTPEWTLSPSSYNGSPITLQWTGIGWTPYADGNIIGATIGDKGSVELRWVGDWAGSGEVLSATRQNPYAILGNQTSVELALKDHGHTADEVGAVALTAVGQVYNGSSIAPYQGLRIDEYGKLAAVVGNGMTLTGDAIELDQDSIDKLNEARDAYTGLSSKADKIDPTTELGIVRGITVNGDFYEGGEFGVVVLPNYPAEPIVPPVSSVNGQTGDVLLSALDVGALPLSASAEFVRYTNASDVPPYMDGEAAAGGAYDYSRADHRHPSDTSRVPTTRTVNGKALSADVTLSGTDILVGGDQPWANAPVDIMLADIITYQIPTVEAKIPAVSAETWTFTMQGGTTVTKSVAVY